MITILDFVLLRVLMVVLYPRLAFPDRITSCNLELIDSTVFFDFFAAGAIIYLCCESLQKLPQLSKSTHRIRQVLYPEGIFSFRQKMEDQDSQQTIAYYREQLEQVDRVLETDSSNEQYQVLRSNLLDVISMTEQLREAQQRTDTSSSIDLVPGDRIEVISGERPYPAVVISVNVESSSCTLKYYEFGTEVTLPLTSLRKITGRGLLPRDRVAPGLKCQCKFATDQKWYDAKIESVTTDGFMVAYVQYGNKEEVPLEYIRPMPLSSLQGKRNAPEKLEPAVLIPDNLKILPSDTEEVKENTISL
jgi:transcription antitermination factor NusG